VIFALELGHLGEGGRGDGPAGEPAIDDVGREAVLLGDLLRWFLRSLHALEDLALELGRDRGFSFGHGKVVMRLSYQ